MTVSDVAGRFKTALVTAATVAINDPTVKVCYGHPGKDQPDDIVSVQRVTAVQDSGPMSSTNRARDLTLNCTIVASVYRAGGPEAEQVAGDRAYQLIDAIEEYVRNGDNTRLGGLVWWCFCTSHDSDGSSDPQVLAKGRVIEVAAVFTARARITN